MKRYNSYIICANPRSGSTLLCKLLASTGVAGKPESYFHLPSLAKWAKDCHVPFHGAGSERDVMKAVLKHVRSKGAATTDVFGLRLMRKSFEYLMAKLDVQYPGLPSDNARFNAVFGPTLYIHLTRRDKVAQAISTVKAMQTGLWHMAPDGAEIERTAPAKAPQYDRDLIERELAELTAYEQDWDLWFRQEQIKPLCVTYESLAQDPSKTLIQILDRLGLDRAAARGVIPEVAQLADATNHDWINRFRAEQSSV